MVAVLEGFLVPIWKELLEVKVDDVTISRETLDTVIEGYEAHIDSYTSNIDGQSIIKRMLKRAWGVGIFPGNLEDVHLHSMV